jgi:hypothetical protein
MDLRKLCTWEGEAEALGVAREQEGLVDVAVDELQHSCICSIRLEIEHAR